MGVGLLTWVVIAPLTVLLGAFTAEAWTGWSETWREERESAAVNRVRHEFQVDHYGVGQADNHSVGMALMDWSLDHQIDCLSTYGTYPDSFAELVTAGYLTAMPTDPFGQGTLVELLPGEPNRPGGFRYIPLRTRFTLDDGSVVVENASYLFVYYLPDSRPIPASRVERLSAYFAGMLGDEPMVIETTLPEGFSETLAESPARSPAVREMQARIVDSRRETEIEALTRLGYAR